MSLRYKVQVDIDRPMDEVVNLFQNRENDRHWMDGLKEQEVLEGTMGEEGCLTRLVFSIEGGEFEMNEKLQKKNLPEEYTTFYETGHTKNTVISSFENLDNNRTRYTTDNEFHFEGEMEEMAKANPDAFKQQSQIYLDNFKKFVESAV